MGTVGVCNGLPRLQRLRRLPVLAGSYEADSYTIQVLRRASTNLSVDESHVDIISLKVEEAACLRRNTMQFFLTQ